MGKGAVLGSPALSQTPGGRLRLVLLSLILLAAGCAAKGNDSDREWQRAECNRIIDAEARDRCYKRVDADYGGSRSENKDTRRK